MAIIQFGGLITKMSGKIGGQTIGNNKAGTFIKNTGTYKKTHQTARQTLLSRFQANALSWGSLSDFERASWAAAAPNYPYINRLGESKTYSGYQLYVMFNGNLRVIGSTAITTAPATYNFAGITGFALTAGVGTISTAGGTAADDNVTYVLYATPPVSRGNVSSKGNLKILRQFTPAQITTSILITSDYEAAFGELVPGAVIHWRLDAIHTARGIRYSAIRSGVLLL